MLRTKRYTSSFGWKSEVSQRGVRKHGIEWAGGVSGHYAGLIKAVCPRACSSRRSLDAQRWNRYLDLVIWGDSMMKESKHVRAFRGRHLQHGEEIASWAEGYIGKMMGSGDETQHNGVLLVTGVRVAFYRKGILGEILETIPLRSNTSIERCSVLGHRTVRMHTSHDSLEFKTLDKPGEQNVITAIEGGRSQWRPAQVEMPSDPLEAIRKLGELRDAGVLSEQEFETKKCDLLAKV